MKTAIVGCGLNSDYHINFAGQYEGAEIVGIADRDNSKARACAEKHGIQSVFSGVRDLIEGVQPDVVHIVTPPQTHAFLAGEAIRSGTHVLIEKPLTLNASEARELFDLAGSEGVKLCAMHNHYYDPCMIKAHDLVREGKAGEITNVESYYGLNTQTPAFRDYPAPNVLPWLYSLPGGVYQDFMAHPLSVMLDYTGKPKEIKVFSRSHGVLPQNMPDELKIVIDGELAFGTVTMSFAARPRLHFLRLYGTSMTIDVDFNTMCTVIHPASSLPKAAQKAAYNLSASRQLATNTVSNVYRFLRGSLKPCHGMKTLIHRFYDSILNHEEPPVTRSQALLVMETMDEIWRQLRPRPLSFDPVMPRHQSDAEDGRRVLVTGGTGFLGGHAVKALLKAGYSVRVLARKLSNTEGLVKQQAEIFYGDVADRKSLAEAFRGVRFVVHAAAGTSGRKSDCDSATLQGTRNVLELCRTNNVSKLVYVSSCSVYGIADCAKNQTVTEESPLERFPFRRGEYSASKQRAEELVRTAMACGKFPVTVLRPGTIYGPGGDIFPPMIGISVFKRVFVVFGPGSLVLPYVYIDNLVHAVVRCLESEQADNQIFNVVDDHGITKRQYMEKIVKPLYPAAKILYVPAGMLSAAVGLQEAVFGTLNRTPILTRYRLLSSRRNVRYDSSKITRLLQWCPVVSFEGAAERIIQSRMPPPQTPDDIAPEFKNSSPALLTASPEGGKGSDRGMERDAA